MQYTIKTIELENCTITIHRPNLTKEAQKKVEQEVVKALENFGKEMEKRQNGYEI